MLLSRKKVKYRKQIRLRRRILVFSISSIIVFVSGSIYYFYLPGVEGLLSLPG